MNNLQDNGKAHNGEKHEGDCSALQGAPLQLFDVSKGAFAAFPREVVAAIWDHLQQNRLKQYAYLDCTVPQVEGVYALYGTYDDIRIFWTGPFALQVKDNYVFFHPQDECAHGAQGTIWILCDTMDDVSIGMGGDGDAKRVRLNGLLLEDQHMVFVCQLRIAGFVK